MVTSLRGQPQAGQADNLTSREKTTVPRRARLGTSIAEFSCGAFDPSRPKAFLLLELETHPGPQKEGQESES